MNQTIRIRRRLLLGASLCLTMPGRSARPASVTLATCPLDLRGDWHGPADSAAGVIARVRQVGLAGLTLRSPAQPDGIIVQNKHGGYPSIWLHEQPAGEAWIMLNMTAPGAWCQLAYQLSHELGHCLANSWKVTAAPKPPSQWLEESLAEAFALRTLGLLAESWQADPVFAGQAGYANAIRDYRQAIVSRYRQDARSAGATDLLRWFDKERGTFIHVTGLDGIAQGVVPSILGLIEPEPVLIEEYQGMNLWPERTALPVREYLGRWRESCRAIGMPGRLPLVIADLLGLPERTAL
ncbi:hypothetical protein [Rhodopila globiformis]|uniref:IrrE N-terminal-like domain-containing protein n=1 Tax=Rhodopila globiformis TaxID=1071 RepID=A0A2S6MU85_RHOGL|nr:hypothetical protein [Rhodopila globiformis]PPQ25919.1 hypothetical protein CCS01_31615 [Rhodopila globiformis]